MLVNRNEISKSGPTNNTVELWTNIAEARTKMVNIS